MPQSVVSHLEYDELCDLPTLMYFRQYAGRYVRAGRRRGHAVYLLYFNLENFSMFNERYGFDEGDRLIRLTSIAIQAAFPGFLVSRISEAHFLLVCESLDVEAAIMDVRDQLHAYGRHANVELKAGILRVTDDGMSVSKACDCARIACENIAHRHDRTFRWYDEALAWRMERKHYIENHIDRAIEKGWIEIYYQPIVRSISGRVCEFEALARWNDPRYGFLSPAVFVEVLEETRLIHKLDACMVRLACAEWRRTRDEDSVRIPVSINLSRFDFELCDVFQMVDSIAAEYEVPRQMLHLEVTESALNERSNLLGHEIERFRNAGYQVWIDDFGSGYSSLNTLKDYVFDVVKIDMVFLREFDSKPKSRAIIASVVNMAKQLGMQTLIEGVETAEQFEFVRSIGCEFVQGYLIGRPSTRSMNVKRILAGELVMENPTLHGYYDKIGGVNSLSATPFDFPWEEPVDERPFAEMLPLATIEFENGSIRVMSANETFSAVIDELHLESISSLAKTINQQELPQTRAIRALIEAAIASDSLESVDLLVNGMHCVLRVRHISSYRDVDALLVSLMNLSRFSDTAEDKLHQIAVRNLYATYDEVNIVDLSDGTVSTLYRGNSWFPTVSTNVLAVEATREFARKCVHPDDRARYEAFMDMGDIMKRVESSKRTSVAEAFRVLCPLGTYGWITVVLVPMEIDDSQAVLQCIRPVNAEVCSTMAGDQTLSKSLLWDSLINLIPVGVFWKDRDRRFMGVNRTFLEYYELNSTNEVLGKNDEEMGWHVDANPYKNDELRVIEDGESIRDAPGTCISRGEVRNILANKIPLRRNGEIVGLLGYFVDTGGTAVEHRVHASDVFEDNIGTDNLTGISNEHGFMLSAAAYHKAYEVTGQPFVVVTADIRDTGGLKQVYGHEFGNRILQTVARRLVKLYDVSGSVARIAGDRFAALRQVSTDAEARDEAERLRDAVELVHDVDGITVHLRCVVGWALNTEAASFHEVFLLAEQRLSKELDKELMS